MSHEITRLNSVIKDVPLAKMRVSDQAQRGLVTAHWQHINKDFDPEMLGLPVVNQREPGDSVYWVIDGQHRIYVVKVFLGDDWKKQNLTVRLYVGLTLVEEAEMFLQLNYMRAISAFDRFKVAVTAEREAELTVKRTVEACGLHIARQKRENVVNCVNSLMKVYAAFGAVTLGRTLNIVYQAFGTPGLTNEVIEGVALVCQRYNGALKDVDAIARWHDVRGGVGALMTKSHMLREQLAQPSAACFAATAIDVLNRTRGAKKMAPWFKA